MSSVSKEVEARKVTGALGEIAVCAAEQSEWELALGLQAVGALELGKQRGYTGS